jgi:hypothetical protein
VSLLSIVNNAQDEIGIARLAAVAAGTDLDARLMLGLANREGKKLSRRASWQALTKEKTFDALAQESQTAMIPSDFQRFVNETFYNRTRKRRFNGPLTPQEWQAQKALTSQTVGDDLFRVRGSAILLMPTPTAGDTYAYEYVTKQWCTDSTGATPKEAFTVDTDVSLLDEDLMTLGVIWRWKAAKGLDYAEDFRSYEMDVAQAIARDGAKRTISMSGDKRLNVGPGVPEGSWSL